MLGSFTQDYVSPLNALLPLPSSESLIVLNLQINVLG